MVIGSSVTYLQAVAALGPIVATITGAILAWKLRQVHTLVNSQFSAALARIGELEGKLGLTAGEAIPTAPILTAAGLGAPPVDLPVPGSSHEPPPASPRPPPPPADG